MRAWMAFALTLTLLAFSGEVQAQSCASTQGQLEICKSLTNAVRFGFPRYTTAQLPTCNANNKGAMAFDTTATAVKYCDGSAYVTFASSGGGTLPFSSLTSGTNTSAAMLVGTGASLGFTGTGTIAASTTNIIIANASVTGTTANYLAKLTGAPSTAVIAATTDTQGVVGIVVSGAGTTGSATIARSGSASCVFDGATTAGDYVQISSTAAGKCHDTGSSTYPASGQVLGRVLSTNGAGGTYAMTLHMGTQGDLHPLTSDGTNVTLSSGHLKLSSASTVFFGPLTTSYPALTSSGVSSANLAVVLGDNSDYASMRLKTLYLNGTQALANAPSSGVITLQNGTATDFARLQLGGTTSSFPAIKRDGAALAGVFADGTGPLTPATMTAEHPGLLATSTSSYTWTNAMVVALGASLTGDIKVATLPAKTQVIDAAVVITGTAAGTTTLTVACGRTSAGYIDYIVASDAQAAANTVYGDTSGERGTNLTGYDLPSYTGTTDVYCHFISTGSNLSAVTGSTGRVILTTRQLP